MLEFLNQFREWIKDIAQLGAFFQKRYKKPRSTILLPSQGLRPQPKIIDKYNFEYICADLIVFLLFTWAVLTILRYWSSYDLAKELYSISSDEIVILRKSRILLNSTITYLLYIIACVVLVLTFIRYLVKWITLKSAFATLLLAMSIVATTYFFPLFSAQLEQFAAFQAYDEVVSTWEEQNYGPTINPLRQFHERAPLPSIRDDALGKLAGSLHWEGDYRAAVEESCKFIVLYPNSEIIDAQIVTLHWAIYQLGKAEGYESAEQFLIDLTTEYGYLCEEHASPFWLGISERAGYDGLVQDLPFPVAADVEDLPWLETFARNYPAAVEAEYALFITADYEKLINEYPNSLLREMAYYQRARMAWENGDTDRAIEYYHALLVDLPSSEYVLSAYSDLGDIYQELGDYRSAIDYYLLYRQVYQEEHEVYFLADSRMMYIIDVKLDVSELHNYILERSKKTDYGMDVLFFSLAERYFAEQQWTLAEEQFRHVIQQYPSDRMAELAALNLQLTKTIQTIFVEPEPDALIKFANLLLSEERLIFYNELWADTRASVTNNVNTPIEYFERNSDYLVAANALEQFQLNYSADSRYPDVLLMLGNAYERLGYLDAYVPLQGNSILESRRVYREKAEEIYRRVAQSNLRLRYREIALNRLANLYLNQPHDFERAREVLREIVDTYPQHNISNNALNWIAYIYSIEANLHPIYSPDYITNYQKALLTYEEILLDYPNGHVADQARQNIQIISEKLVNPAKRRERPPMP